MLFSYNVGLLDMFLLLTGSAHRAFEAPPKEHALIDAIAVAT